MGCKVKSEKIKVCVQEITKMSQNIRIVCSVMENVTMLRFKVELQFQMYYISSYTLVYLLPEQAGIKFSFTTKNCKQGGKICNLLHMNLRAGWKKHLK